MSVHIGLTVAQRTGAAKILNGILADEYVLYTKTRNFHWNVTGPHFSELHKFFESQYEELDEAIDDIAERVRALDQTPLSTLKGFLENTRLKESSTDLSAAKMIEALLSDHEAIVRQLRADLETIKEEHGDTGNQDFLTGLMEQHEKMAWMLRALSA
jgi:starvation-inducible DNA-binding protein